ncbi:hypothetical protein GCM10011506_19830 [Marivirga lumbricoides]|uniref:Uncharacterized protein n=1 Tax=Marivirga lumbricoides TaxID=1046115 RepID=A0ABQ1M6C5_9BACT|nr:hypothetical protein GCM10011506_19830 [Marivirga lumbricoides]
MTRIIGIAKITEKIYAVQYEKEVEVEDEDEGNDATDIFSELIVLWNDQEYLRNFFNTFKKDYEKFYGHFRLKEVVREARNEAKALFQQLKNCNDTELEELFKPLHNEETSSPFYELQKLKSYGPNYKSYLRIYAIKYDDAFVISGGAIKLTEVMKGRPHLEDELFKMDLAIKYLTEIL